MDTSAIPTKYQTPFGVDAGTDYIRTVPQTSADPNAASFDQGFPPNTFVPEGGGGSPPNGRDFNGILNSITAWLLWVQAGGAIKYDGTFSSQIGGYPKGAVIASATNLGLLWLSTTDNNTTNPDSGGAGWVQLLGQEEHYITTASTGTLAVPAWASRAWMEVWGGGGGGSGGIGASGAAGGYSAGWFSVTPGETLTLTVASGGAGASNGAQAGNGATSKVVNGSSVTLLLATGGAGGGGAPGIGGSGSGGSINIQGQAGMDIDGSTIIVADGGSSPRGGFGGRGSAPSTLIATVPGGGGGAGSSHLLGGDGAVGGVYICFTV